MRKYCNVRLITQSKVGLTGGMVFSVNLSMPENAGSRFELFGARKRGGKWRKHSGKPAKNMQKRCGARGKTQQKN